MKTVSLKYLGLGLGVITALAACSQANVDVSSDTASNIASNAKKTSEASSDFHFMLMDEFNQDMARFVGLSANESFASAETKINAVFKAYDGHAKPLDIRMNSEIVEAGWKQVLVTQDGLMDGTVTGQQLLAIFDDEQKLVTYGMRIKCHSDNGGSEWQKTPCG